MQTLHAEEKVNSQVAFYPLNQVDRASLFPTFLLIGNHINFTKFEQQKIKNSFCQFYYAPFDPSREDKIIERVEKLITQTKKLTLVFNLPPESSSSIVNYFTKLEFKNVHFKTFPRFVEEFFFKVYLHPSEGHLAHLQNIKPLTKSQYFAKRLIDYTFCLSTLLLSWPLFIFLAWRIKHESPGPILFRQTRIGKDGRPFKCYKFRSMNLHGPFNRYTQKADERIFPFGDFMRKSRLDELPQIINILKGEMHLIGPRPEWDILVRDYEKTIPNYHQRHLMLPGISGWAQVNYRYGASTEDARQKLMYDLYYLKKWSIRREIFILFKTLYVVLRKRGH